MLLQWIGASTGTKQRSTKAEDLRLLNGYVEAVESKQGKSALKVFGSPGLKRFAVLPHPSSGACRGMFTTSQGRCFVVKGDQLYELGSSGLVTVRGSLRTSAGPVSFAENGLVLVVVDGTYGEVLTLADNSYAHWTDPEFTGAAQIGFLDARLVFPQPNSDKYWWTDPVTTDIDGLNFASAEGSPDLIVAQVILHRELWFLGKTSIEVHGPTGDPDTPFARNNAVFIEQGCAAGASASVVGETLCWLSHGKQGDGMVMQAQGYNPRRISTHPIEQAIQSYSRIDDAIGWGQVDEGHLYYWLTFPTGNATWVWDATTELWHERGYLDPSTGDVGRHRASGYTFAHGKHLCCDFGDGRVYELDHATYTDDGAPLLLEVIPPPLFDAANGYRVVQNRLEMDMEVGVGLDGGVIPGSTPQIRLAISNDGGQTWGTEQVRSLGAIGKTRQHVCWYRLGSGYDRRCKVRMSDPVKRVILNLWTDAEALRA